MPASNKNETKSEQVIALNTEQTKEIKKKVRKIKKKQQKMLTDEDVMKSRGVVLLSHVPKYFQEPQMHKFFSQFGDVTRLRLIRSKKSGNPKGFAFVEFEFKEVAKVVAETMNNYLMFQRIMKCKLLDEVKEHTFSGWNKPFRIRPRRTIAIRNHNIKNPDKVEKSKKRIAERRAKQQEKFAALGIDYDISKLTAKDDFKPEMKKMFTFEEFDKLKRTSDRSKTAELEASTDAVAVIDESDDEIVLKVTKKMKVKTIKSEKVETKQKKTKTEIVPKRNKKKSTATAVENKEEDEELIKPESKPRRSTRKSAGKLVKAKEETTSTVKEMPDEDLAPPKPKAKKRAAMNTRKSAGLNKSVVEKKPMTRKRKANPNKTM